MHGAAPDAAASNPVPPDGPESKPPTSNAPPDESGPGEKTPADHRSANLRPPWPKGTSGNPAGRPAGVGNLNAELRAAVLAWKRGERTWLEILLERAIEKPEVAIKLLDKIFATVTPETPGVVVNNSLEGLLARLQGGDEVEPDPEFPDAGKKE